MVSFNNDESRGDDKSAQNDKLVEAVSDCVPESVLGALFTPKGMDGLVGSGANTAPQGEELFIALVKAKQAIQEGVTSEKLSEISDLVLEGLKSVKNNLLLSDSLVLTFRDVLGEVPEKIHDLGGMESSHEAIVRARYCHILGYHPKLVLENNLLGKIAGLSSDEEPVVRQRSVQALGRVLGYLYSPECELDVKSEKISALVGRAKDILLSARIDTDRTTRRYAQDYLAILPS